MHWIPVTFRKELRQELRQQHGGEQKTPLELQPAIKVKELSETDSSQLPWKIAAKRLCTNNGVLVDVRQFSVEFLVVGIVHPTVKLLLPKAGSSWSRLLLLAGAGGPRFPRG